MSTVEAVLPWISSLDIGPLSRVSLTGARPAAPRRARPPARWRSVRESAPARSARSWPGRWPPRKAKRSVAL